MDVTGLVAKAVRASGVQEGLALVHSPHTTAAVVVNERESRLVQDLLVWAQRVVPEGAGYGHDASDGNAHAHLQGVLLNASAVVPVSRGELALGTWQAVLFVELDGPRSRNLLVQVVGR